MKFCRIPRLLLLALLVCPLAAAAETGFFQVAQDQGWWRLIDPAGGWFYSTGVNVISPGGHGAPALGYSPYYRNLIELYGSEQAWAEVTTGRMQEWGFNTLGGWSSPGLFPETPYTGILYLSGADWESGKVPDYFSEEFSERVENICAGSVAEAADDPRLLGWFLDNEMRWGADWRVQRDLFADYFAFAADAPGKAALVELLRERYHDDIAAFNAAWGTSFTDFDSMYQATTTSALPANQAQADDREAFLALAAERFFSVAVDGVRRHDPNHLVLGSRLVSWITPVVVLEACARHVDVISLNHYRVWPFFADALRLIEDELRYVSVDDESTLAEFHQATGMPLLISEFSMRGMDSGLPNTKPPNFFFFTAETQADRALLVEQMTRAWIEGGYVVGYHWFDWMDEPASGRFDGENSNFGLVTEADEPYQLLTERFTEINAYAQEYEPPPADDDDDDAADDDDTDDDNADDDSADDDADDDAEDEDSAQSCCD